ncbi:MAG: GHKL domain-containing protein [Candidatus Omnitrophica bacterium]|nr:GHKL domain-containing protein [Candidatus Omnitrophota bacterium]
MDIIETSAIRCNDIIQSFLGLARVSRGEFVLVKLNKLIDQILVIVKKEMELKDIRIEKDLQPDLADITGDNQLLQEVVLVFISNAKWAIEKRTDKKEGGVIAIRTHQDEAKKLIILSVCDNGVGISRENKAKLFDHFFTTKKEGEGTGLGLSLAKTIILKHNGNIKVESEEGKGSTFSIILPFADAR